MVFVALFAYLPAVTLASDNPFAKEVAINIGSDKEWVIKEKTATRSGSDSGDYYHLFFDRKQLRLRITDGVEDSEATAKKYQQFKIEDVQVDGKRLSVFQWCLNNQQKHSRFLQQGLKVKKDVCSNQGNKGAFVMRLNAKALKVLNSAKELSFKLKPFRTSVVVNFDISDFSAVMAKLSTKPESAQIAKVNAVAKEVVEIKKCNATPPKGFAAIKPVEYNCNDAAAKFQADANVEKQVTEERKHKAKLAAERERKRKVAAAAKKAEELAAKKVEQEKMLAEQAALAETAASRRVVNDDITNKMLAVCQKTWAKGKHRCYCEKFIEHAPAGIESDASCAATE